MRHCVGRHISQPGSLPMGCGAGEGGGGGTVALAMAKLASPETALTLFSDFISFLTLCSGKICNRMSGC